MMIAYFTKLFKANINFFIGYWEHRIFFLYLCVNYRVEDPTHWNCDDNYKLINKIS